MLTWSSWFALEGIESTLSGCERVLLSETNAAAVYWGIIKPLSRPEVLTSMDGKPSLNSGVVRRKVRRSEMLATADMAMLKKFNHMETP